MGHPRSESIMRWVWDANRGRPVRENATLTFGSDGNLVLADVDGKVAWQTGMANRGVVGLSLRPNGNLVLYDDKGQFIWQSFHRPTDTILVGQTIRATGPSILIVPDRACQRAVLLRDGKTILGYVFSEHEFTIAPSILRIR